MNGEFTQNPNSGEARHATRQGSRQSLAKDIRQKRQLEVIPFISIKIDICVPNKCIFSPPILSFPLFPSPTRVLIKNVM